MEICKFYAKGSCAFGTACRYLHESQGSSSGRPSAPRRPPVPKVEEQQLELEEERVDPYDDERCTLSQLREKYFGQYCEADVRKYWQEEMKPAETVRPALRPVTGDSGSRQICRFFLSGSCNFGTACRNLHVLDVDQLDGDPIDTGVTPKTQQRSSASVSNALKSLENPSELSLTGGSNDPWSCPGELPEDCASFIESRYARRSAAVEDAECGICFDSIQRKGDKFGMLECCDHAFCLSCIRAWRKQKEEQDRKNLRMCPVCRKESFFLIPCETLILSPEEKAKAIAGYKREMAGVPCKAFDYGRGKCPFGTSCFYAHLNPDGTRYVAPQPRKMFGSGGSQIIGEVKLCDFFG